MFKRVDLFVNIKDNEIEKETGFYCVLNCDKTVSDEEILITALEEYIQELELEDFKSRHCKYNKRR